MVNNVLDKKEKKQNCDQLHPYILLL